MGWPMPNLVTVMGNLGEDGAEDDAVEQDRKLPMKRLPRNPVPQGPGARPSAPARLALTEQRLTEIEGGVSPAPRLSCSQILGICPIPAPRDGGGGMSVVRQNNVVVSGRGT